MSLDIHLNLSKIMFSMFSLEVIECPIMYRVVFSFVISDSLLILKYYLDRRGNLKRNEFTDLQELMYMYPFQITVINVLNQFGFHYISFYIMVLRANITLLIIHV